MRYWLVTTEFPPGGGGIAPYCLFSAEMLSEAGVDATIFHFEGKAVRPEAERLFDRARLVRFHDRYLTDHRQIDCPVGPALEASWYASEFIADAIARWGKPDVIEFQDYNALGFFTLLKRYALDQRFEGVKIVLTAHRPSVHTYLVDEHSTHRLPHFFVGEMERWCYAAADAVFYPSEFIERRLRAADLNFRPRLGFTVRNPFEAERGRTPHYGSRRHRGERAGSALRQAVLTKAAVAAQWPPGWVKPAAIDAAPILFLGKLQVQKGVLDALKLMDRWWSEGGAAPLALYGRDALYGPLECSMRGHLEIRYRRRIDQGLLRIEGAYERAEMDALLAAGPVVLMPNREECMPYVALEIISGGGIPLTAPGGGQEELIAPAVRDQLVFDPANFEEFRRKLQTLYELTPKHKAQLTERLRDHIRTIASYRQVVRHKLDALEAIPDPASLRDYPFITPIEKAPNARRDLQAFTPRRLSVVIPYYNMQDYIFDALDSVLASNYHDIEIIIVDDGSPSVAAKRKLDDIVDHRIYGQFVRIVRKTNGGLASARNAGGEAATGEFVLFLDADDVIEPTFVDRCIAMLDRYDNLSWASSWLRSFGASDWPWLTWPFEFPYSLYHSTQHCTILVRRDDWLNHGVNDPAMRFAFEDYESLIGMTKKGVRGATIPSFLFRYRVRPDSMMRALRNETQAFLYRLIQRKHPDLFKEYGPALTALAAENGHGSFVSDPTRDPPAAQWTFPRSRGAAESVDEAYRTGDFDEALVGVRTRLLNEGESAGAWYMLGQVLWRQGRAPLETFDAYSKAAELDPGDYWPILMRARLLLEFGLRSDAELELGRMLKEAPDASGPLLWLARESLWEGLPTVALGLAKAAGPSGAAVDYCARLLFSPPGSTPHLAEEDEALAVMCEVLCRLQRGEAGGVLQRLDGIEAPASFFSLGAPRYARLMASRGAAAAAALLLDWAKFAMPEGESTDALIDVLHRGRLAGAKMRIAKAQRDGVGLADARAALFSAMPWCAEARVEAADEALAKGEAASALLHLDAVLVEPAALSSPWVWARRFDALARMGRAGDAIAALEEVGVWDFDDLAGPDLLHRINPLIQSGDIANAHAYLSAIRDRYKHLEDLQLWWASTAVSSGIWDRRVDEQLLELIQTASTVERKAWASYHLARLHSRRGEHQQAKAAAQSIADAGVVSGVDFQLVAKRLMEEVG